MSPKDLKLMEAFMAFIEDAGTRSGVDFVFESFQSGQGNESTKAKGKVLMKANDQRPDIPLTMEWDLKGNALMIGTQFDLVSEVPFHEND